MEFKFEPNYLYSYMLKTFVKNRNKLDKEAANERYPEGQKKTIKFYNLGGTRCFDKNQKVVTTNGSKPICELTTSDYVKSYNHENGEIQLKRVENVIITKDSKKPCFDITLINGQRIKCTRDHHFYCNGKYRTIEEILFGISGEHVDGFDKSLVESAKNIIIDELYDLTVEGNHNYYLDCGFDVLVHNSSKTYDEIHLIYTFCEHNKRKPLYIAVYRETLVKCRDTTLKDFKECFTMMGLEKDKDYILTGEVNGRPIINLFGSIIEFKGYPESGKEAGRSDIVFINEILESSNKDVIMGIYQRCELLFIADANPAVTDHWVFSQDKQFNTFMTKTTYLDNRHLAENLSAEYESWCPWDFNDSHIERVNGFNVRVWDKPECGEFEPYDENKHRRPNLLNEERGTINKFRYLVYGEGIRAARDGAIFSDAKWEDEFPDSGFDEVVISMDFGYTSDSTTLVRTGVRRKSMEATIECMACQPTKTPEITFNLIEPCLLKELERRKKEGIDSDELWICCESQDKYAGTDWVVSLNQIANLKGYNWNFFKISKKSILAGVSIMLRFKLTLIRMDKLNPNKDRFVLEQQNYIYKIHPTTQKPTNEPDPDSKYCDIWDAARYGFQNNFAHLTKDNG